MQTAKTYITTNDLETEYLQVAPLEHRKKFAQFFTPYRIADLMVKWLLDAPSLEKILEPAFGLGIFSRILLNNKASVNIKGFEIDQQIFKKSQDVFVNEPNINIQLGDYMYNDWSNKYDGIICNPPYFKFHDYDNKGILKELENKASYKLNGFTNLYTAFLLKSLHQLKKDGRAAYIVPSEFLNSDYGKAIKSYLIKSQCLRHVIIIDFKENVFDNALTTASILLLANDKKADSVQFSNVESLDDFAEIEEAIKSHSQTSTNQKSVKFNELNPDIKWRNYYQKQNGINFSNLVPFSHFGKVVRGIATGANEYFIFNRSKAKDYNIVDKYLLPCICKAADVKNSFFTEQDFESLERNDKSAFLFNAVNPQDSFVEEYIKKGISEAIHEKHLPAHRKIWYLPENRLPAPIWVSVFNRDDIKFIRNEANIKNLTTFHCIYVNNNLYSGNTLEQTTDLFFAYLITDVARSIFNDNRREYGNGLKKFEPNDINKSNILNLESINYETKNKILSLYRQYRESVITKMEDKKTLSEINEIFINYFAI